MSFLGQSVFIQSAQMNDMFRMDHKTVCKIPAGHEVDIFDNQKFAARLGKLVEFGFEAVYRLYEMCTIRLSFVKGWGSEYRNGFFCLWLALENFRLFPDTMSTYK